MKRKKKRGREKRAAPPFALVAPIALVAILVLFFLLFAPPPVSFDAVGEALSLPPSQAVSPSLSAELVPAPEVLFSAGFEAEEQPENLFVSSTSPGTTARFVFTNQEASAGSQSAHIQYLEGGYRASYELTNPIAPWQVIPGNTYRVSVQAKAKNVTAGGYITVMARIKDNNGAAFLHTGNSLLGTTGWQELSVQFTAPQAGVNTFQIFLVYYNGGGGEVWFDEVRIEDLLAPTAQETVTQYVQTADQYLPRLKKLLSPTAALSQAIREFEEFYPVALDLHGSVGAAALSREQKKEVLRNLGELVRREQKLFREGNVGLALQRFRVQTKQKFPELVFAWVSPLDKIFPEDLPVDMVVSKTKEMSVFPGEVEPVQLLVYAPYRSLSNVSLHVEPLGARSKKLLSEHFSVKAIGSVRIAEPISYAQHPHQRIPYDPSQKEDFLYSGWYPDVLVDSNTIDLPQQKMQSFWIQVKVPRGQAPGTYTNKVTLSAPGIKTMEASLKVKVLADQLPEQWHLKKIMSFNDAAATAVYGDRWASDAALRNSYYDFLVDNRIGLSSIYGGLGFPRESLLQAVGRGQNIVNVGAFNPSLAANGTAFWLAGVENTFNRMLTQEWPWVEENSLSGMAYAYGCDEAWRSAFETCAAKFAILKEQTSLKTISTLKDYSYGRETPFGQSLDAFVPTLEFYSEEEAARARAEGKEVWWYSTSDSSIETAAYWNRARGWISFALGAEGYLLWTTNAWTLGGNLFFTPPPLQNTPGELYLNWNPSFPPLGAAVALLIYPGSNGPVSSMRLENMRDGFEDYDLLYDTLVLFMEKNGMADQEAARQGLLRELQIPSQKEELLKTISSNKITEWRTNLVTLREKLRSE